jgi:hypothetical protein
VFQFIEALADGGVRAGYPRRRHATCGTNCQGVSRNGPQDGDAPRCSQGHGHIAGLAPRSLVSKNWSKGVPVPRQLETSGGSHQEIDAVGWCLGRRYSIQIQFGTATKFVALLGNDSRVLV